MPNILGPPSLTPFPGGLNVIPGEVDEPGKSGAGRAFRSLSEILDDDRTVGYGR